jgi:hypothetical protein
LTHATSAITIRPAHEDAKPQVYVPSSRGEDFVRGEIILLLKWLSISIASVSHVIGLPYHKKVREFVSSNERYKGPYGLNSPIAQLVEQMTVNHWVTGSSPVRGASIIKDFVTRLSVSVGQCLQKYGEVAIQSNSSVRV